MPPKQSNEEIDSNEDMDRGGDERKKCSWTRNHLNSELYRQSGHWRIAEQVMINKDCHRYAAECKKSLCRAPAAEHFDKEIYSDSEMNNGV